MDILCNTRTWVVPTESQFLLQTLQIFSVADHRTGSEGLGLPGELGHAQHQRQEEAETGAEHQAGESDGGGRGGRVLGRRE